MTYDCINGWEDIIGRLLDRKVIDRTAFDALDDDDSAGIAHLALEGIDRLHTERQELRDALAELQEWAVLMGGWEAPAWERARTILATVAPSVPDPEIIKREDRIVALAFQQSLFTDGEVECGERGESALVSEGDDNGAYVHAWVWVSFEGTEYDKTEPKVQP